MGGNTQTKTESNNQQTAPWAAQQPYLQQAFTDAQNTYQGVASTRPQWYTGDFYAQPTQAMTDAFKGNLDFASGTGKDAATTAAQTGTTAAQTGLAGSQSALGQIMGMTGDQTQNNITAASAYANNPQMDAMVQAATRDATRNFNETTMPTIDRTAAATGNLNSTRTGVAQGIAQRGLQDTVADVSANLRGAAYQNGISQAQQDYNNRVGAMTSGAGVSGNLISSGLAGLESGANINNTNTNTNLTAATMLNGFDQSKLDNEFAKYQESMNGPWQNLNNYFSLIGANNWGSQSSGTGTSKTTTTPSTMSTVGSGLAVIGSLLKGR